MATVQIRGAKVDWVYEGKGFKCHTSYKDSQGNERKEYYKVWTDAKVQTDDVVDVEGLLSVRLEEYTTADGDQRKVAAVHVNRPNVGVVAPADAPF